MPKKKGGKKGKAAAVDESVEVQPEPEPVSEEPWICAECEQENECTDEACIACDEPRPQAAEPEAVDLVARMLRLDEARRLPIARVLEHPLWWDASKRLEKISEWKATWWDRDRRAALKQRLAAHQRSCREIRGKNATGWLARLDDCVVERWGVVATPMVPIRSLLHSHHTVSASWATYGWRPSRLGSQSLPSSEPRWSGSS